MPCTNSMCFFVKDEQDVLQIVRMYCRYQRLVLLIAQTKDIVL